MWQFLVFLLLALLYPGSLLLPGVFGLVMGLTAAVFGTMIGDWVDSNPRMKGAAPGIVYTRVPNLKECINLSISTNRAEIIIIIMVVNKSQNTCKWLLGFYLLIDEFGK